MSTSEYPAGRVSPPRLPNLRGAVGTREVPADVWIMGAIVVVAAVIRIIVIDNQSIWWDESLTAYEVRLPFGAMINTVLHVETTPPLYFVLIWGWAHVFGESDVALRAVSTLAGIALVPIAYLSARELVSRRAGVVAAAFVALNPFMIWYSQEARAYMLLAALTGASFLWFVRARREPSARNLIWWAIWSSLALMTHFFAGFAIATEAVWLLWIARTRLVAAAVGVVVLVQVAMLPFAGADTTHGVGWISRIHRIHRIATMIGEWGLSIVYRRVSIPEDLVGGAIFLLVVVLLLVLGGDNRTRSGAKVAGGIAAAAILLPLALGFLGQDYFISRNLIPAFIPLTTVVAAACVVPRARVIGGAFAIALLVMFSVAAATVQTEPSLQRPDWRAIARAIGPTTVPRAVLFAGGTYADPLRIYVPQVAWAQPGPRRVRIEEIDLVGRLRWLPPLRRGAPRGMTLLGIRTADNVAVDRLRLRAPTSITIDALVERAPHLFRRYHGPFFVFVQRPGT